MNDRLGMDTGAAVTKRNAMQIQINALSAIATDLQTTHSAAQYPHLYGIDSGERTVAPWSVHNLSSAKSSIVGASSAANTLLAQIGAESQAQEEASGNPWNAVTGTYGVLGDISGWRRWVSWPRTLLELPAAVRMLGMQGRAPWATGLNPRNWWLGGSSTGGAALRTFTMNTQTPRWIRSMYVRGNNLKVQNLINPNYVSTVGRHARTPAWIRSLQVNNAGVVSRVGTAVSVAGKGFAVLGAVGGVANIATGINGMMDGDVSSDDAWALADGVVGTVTSIGSLAPPPVGLVFAGVGVAYTAGRWLFGADENGKTGIDKIGDFGRATGEFIGDVGEGIGNVVEDLWPW